MVRVFKRKLSVLGTIVLVLVLVVVLGGGGLLAARLGGFGRNAASGDIELQKGLVGWWKLDGNAKDASPYGNNGTGTNVSAGTDREGKASSAMSFNGTNSYINTNKVYALDVFTVSIWVYSDVSGGARTAISDSRDCCGTGYHGFQLNTSYTGNNANIQIWGSGGTNVAIASGGTTPVGSWTQYTGSYDGTTLRLYQNGVQVATSVAYAGTLGTPTSNVMIGRMGDASAGFFSGKLDDARLYNRALSASEVTALYNAYNPGINAVNGQSGLVGQWSFDGDTKNRAPNGVNGTATSMTLTTDREGKANAAYSFNGTSSNLLVGTSSLFNVGQPGMTLSAWIKINSFGASTQAIINKNGPYVFWIDEANKRIWTGLYKSGAYTWSYSATNALTAGVWTHVAMTYDGTSRKIYVNGAQSGSTDTQISGNIDVVAANLALGYDACCARFYINGSMDDVRIYNRALSSTEIATMYNNYNSRIAVSDLQKGLVGNWPFNGNAKDFAPYGNNNTVTNATLTTDRKGRANSAYSFNGTSALMTLSDIAAYGSNYATVSAWVNPSSTPGSGAAILNRRTAGNVGGFTMEATGTGSINCYFYVGGAWRVATTAAITNGQWTHVVATYDGTTIRTYLNGVASNTAPIAGTLNNPASPTVLIGKNIVGASYWPGSIDDVRLYNRALSAAEVTALYNLYE